MAGPSKKALMALLRKRIDELREFSLKMRSTSILMESKGMAEDVHIKRVGTSLQRLERELRRLQKSNEGGNDERSEAG